jgi:transcription termination/antitermination protein NusG
MSEQEVSPGPDATDPESEEAADLAEAAESGDQAAEVALSEGGGGSEDPLAEATVEPLTELPETADEYVGGEPEPSVEDEAVAESGVAVTDQGAEETEEPIVEVPEAEVEAPEEAQALETEAAEEQVEIPEVAAETIAVPEATPAEESAEVAEFHVSSPFDPPGDWYVVHTYAGYENKVKTNLHSRISSMQMEEKIFDVVIPMEDVMEIKGGKRQVVQKKVFPGYLLVKMIYDNDSWYVVRNTPGVTGFVSSGTGSKPTPLSRREVEKILAVKEETHTKPQYRLEWEEGDVVRIIAGPFADFAGTIAEINVEQSKLKVLVNIFDRETPVELAFDQVAKS